MPIKIEIHVGEFMSIDRINQRFKDEMHTGTQFLRPFDEKTGNAPIDFRSTPAAAQPVREQAQAPVSLRETFREKYRPEANQTVRESYHPNGAVKTQFIYDQNGNQVRQLQFNEDGSPRGIINFGRTTDETITFYEDGYQISVNDKQGNTQKTSFYNPAGVKTEETAYNGNRRTRETFDETTGAKLTSTSQTRNPKPTSDSDRWITNSKRYFNPENGVKTDEIIYNNGQVSKETFYDPQTGIRTQETTHVIPVYSNGQPIPNAQRLKHINFYDEKGNWVEKQIKTDPPKTNPPTPAKLLERHFPAENGRTIRDFFDPNTEKQTSRICYNRNGEIVSTVKCDADGNFTDTPNGKFDKVVVQSSGTCWATGAIVSLASTPEGKKLLESCISNNSRTGKITVTFPGKPPSAEPKTYTFTHAELYGEDTKGLSRGDADVRAIELAFLRYFQEEQPYGQSDLDGGSAQWVYEMLGGQQTQTVDCTKEALEQTPPDTPVVARMTDPDAMLEFLASKQPKVAMNIAVRSSEQGNHAYVINKIENGKVYLTETNNTANERIYTVEEFKQYFGSVLTNQGVAASTVRFMVIE